MALHQLVLWPSSLPVPTKPAFVAEVTPVTLPAKPPLPSELDLPVPVTGVAAVVGGNRVVAGRRRDVVAAGDARAGAAVERVQRQPNFDGHCIVFVGARVELEDHLTVRGGRVGPVYDLCCDRGRVTDGKRAARAHDVDVIANTHA